ncbi:MAG: hypothetical protein AAGB97_01305 [Dehalococcoidia bacterium]|nr:hypothetical protein [Chloroflexota bacterium]MBT9158998.1 hypothetical protein [Chloroflexota bacterium]MBT9162780.1 hypothetical protein [Chloroflexota bacterium]
MTKPVKTREEMEREGWKESSLTVGQHLERTVEMYEELGFEVYLEEVDPKDCEECTACYQSGKEKLYRVYTKPLNLEPGRKRSA